MVFLIPIDNIQFHFRYHSPLKPRPPRRADPAPNKYRKSTLTTCKQIRTRSITHQSTKNNKPLNELIQLFRGVIKKGFIIIRGTGHVRKSKPPRNRCCRSSRRILLACLRWIKQPLTSTLDCSRWLSRNLASFIQSSLTDTHHNRHRIHSSFSICSASTRSFGKTIRLSVPERNPRASKLCSCSQKYINEPQLVKVRICPRTGTKC